MRRLTRATDILPWMDECLEAMKASARKADRERAPALERQRKRGMFRRLAHLFAVVENRLDRHDICNATESSSTLTRYYSDSDGNSGPRIRVSDHEKGYGHGDIDIIIKSNMTDYVARKLADEAVADLKALQLELWPPID